MELDAHWDEFAQRLSFVASRAEDGTELARAVAAAEAEIAPTASVSSTCRCPPDAMQAMVGMLGSTGLAKPCSLVVEKPFGHDLASARALNAALRAVLAEESIYRIDHFLGKEAVLNILALRFANGILEPIWNRDHIAYVQIDVPEALDIQGRAAFYEETGRVPRHGRHPPYADPGARRAGAAVADRRRLLQIERTKVFDAIRPLDRERVVFGQYEGYRDEAGVAADSRVETLAAAEVYVDTWRWSGVPFYLRTGKTMAEGRRTVTIGFSEAPLRMFPNHDPDQAVRPSELMFELSDDP